jgi:hypothetical protein
MFADICVMTVLGMLKINLAFLSEVFPKLFTAYLC